MSGLALNNKTVEQEVLEGLALAYPDLVAVEGNLVINRKLATAKRVAVVAMSASGNEPALGGFVGEGMLDIAVVGNKEAAPGPASVLRALQLADRGQGVLLVVLNNAGDVLTRNIVLKQAEKLGLRVECILVQDDVTKSTEQRQGKLGVLPVLKLVGAAANLGMELKSVAALAQSCAEGLASVQLSPADVDGLCPEAVAAKLIEKVAPILELEPGQRVLVILNGNEAATTRELLLLYRSIYTAMVEKELQPISGGAKHYFNGQADTMVQLCLLKMTEEMAALWEQSCCTAYFSKI